MSYLDFIATLVQALAWPIAVLLIVLIFRKKISELLSERMTRFKAGPLEVEWARQISETQAELEEAGATPPVTNSPMDPTMRDLAERSPAAAIVEAFGQIELALRHIARSWLPEEDTDRLGGLRLAPVVVPSGQLSTSRSCSSRLIRRCVARWRSISRSQPRVMASSMSCCSTSRRARSRGA